MPTSDLSIIGSVAPIEPTVWDKDTMEGFMHYAFADAKRAGILPRTEIPRHKNPFSQEGIRLFQLDKASASLLGPLIDSVADTFDEMFPDRTFEGKNSLFEALNAASIDYEPPEPAFLPLSSTVGVEVGIPLMDVESKPGASRTELTAHSTAFTQEIQEL